LLLQYHFDCYANFCWIVPSLLTAYWCRVSLSIVDADAACLPVCCRARTAGCGGQLQQHDLVRNSSITPGGHAVPGGHNAQLVGSTWRSAHACICEPECMPPACHVCTVTALTNPALKLAQLNCMRAAHALHLMNKQSDVWYRTQCV
jgi:hypothetical protein